MEKHIKIIGILHIVYSIFAIVIGILLFAFLTGIGVLSGDEDAVAVLGFISALIGGILFLTAIPGLIGGIFIMQYQEWARILLIVVGFFALVNIPVGTTLGIYTIWVLLQDETVNLFRRGPGIPQQTAPVVPPPPPPATAG